MQPNVSSHGKQDLCHIFKFFFLQQVTEWTDVTGVDGSGEFYWIAMEAIDSPTC